MAIYADAIQPKKVEMPFFLPNFCHLSKILFCARATGSLALIKSKLLPHLVNLFFFFYDTGYPHDGRADKYSYPHDGRADTDSYLHDRHNLYIMLSFYLWLTLSIDKLA